MTKVDDIDKQIINVLNKDARLSYREIAHILNLSVGTVSHRVKRMEESGIILGYYPHVDPEKVGYDFKSIIFLNISKGKLRKVEEKISEYTNVLGVYDVTGDYDAVIIGRFMNRSHLNQFVKEVQTIQYIERTTTSVVLNTLKEDIKIEF
ncbi:MAG TPA: Lrp/AsnC family transcriptional regulator [Candidatus Methanofastidiosa archaeon]|nr:Lrp/AsnC family transcriptional regulator [Candidatus Methanofastidiosa archaeon]